MTKTTCPTCNGFCCRDVGGGLRTHEGAKVCVHDCPDCEAGLSRETHTEPVHTAEEERADVLAFLQHALTYPFPATGAARPQGYIQMLHGLIDSGAHVGAAKRAQQRTEKT